MTSGVFAAVIFAALLHAGWNAIIKFGEDKFQGMVLLSVAHGVIGAGMIMVFPAPSPAALGWLAASVGFHLWYKAFLTGAYHRGDLSRVYPIARGTAPLVVLGISALLLSDTLRLIEACGIVAVGLGIFMMARGVFANREAATLVPFALMAALGTAGYSISDGMGARLSGSVSGYVGWLFFLDACLFTGWGIARRGRGLLPRNWRVLTLGLFAGMASVGAYWIAVWAMTKAPIAIVTALRETSVLFAVLIGVVFLGETADRTKILAACVILAGIVIMRAF
ncbi:peptide ABC transporter permease [Amylibacter marinus]|uniref:Peptide ABC transporter permease n=1 Tax=Amylibacter marinus TaxID=1475483 RepID=A0ABQ5VXD2_9RHOB|nr:EamA family transporter [Amylibacter marinus]GLQ36095.1 peptide ABC transporter permease [Amylibacter marinus]